MYYLIIDTCVWIDLYKKFPEVREKIVNLVKRGKVRLILPSPIIEEWNRQKSKILEERIQSVRGMIKNARTLSEYLDPERADIFKGIIDRFQEQKDRVENIAKEGIQSIEQLFVHSTTIVLEITATAKLQAVDYASAKKAPFKNKNSMADALIIFGVIEHIAKGGLSKCIFVSSNSQDFSSSSNPSKIHEDLKDIFTRNNIRFFINIGSAINEVEANLVSKESILKIEEIVKQDALREALQSLHKYDRQLMESITTMGGFSAMQKAIQSTNEANRQFMERIKISGISAMEETYRTIYEHNRKLMESIKAVGEFPAIQETIKAAMGGISSAIKKTHGQFIESIKATSVSSVWQEAFRKHEESIKALGGLSGIQEAIQMTNEANRQYLESIKMSSGFSEMAESFRSICEQDRQLIETIKKLNLSKTISNPETQKDELTPTNNPESHKPKEPDNREQ